MVPAKHRAAPSGTKARRKLASGMTTSLVGLAWSAGAQSPLAAYLTLGGLLWALLGLHQLGRSGADLD